MPPYFWTKHFGKGEGERIDVEGCAVECRLISGPLNDTERADAHVLIEYNTWHGHIEGLSKDGSRTLAAHQRAALHSLEPNSARLVRTNELKVRSNEILPFPLRKPAGNDGNFSVPALRHLFALLAVCGSSLRDVPAPALRRYSERQVRRVGGAGRGDHGGSLVRQGAQPKVREGQRNPTLLDTCFQLTTFVATAVLSLTKSSRGRLHFHQKVSGSQPLSRTVAAGHAIA